MSDETVVVVDEPENNVIEVSTGEQGLRGPKGEDGGKGDKGDAGVDGIDGTAGVAGANGKDGADGKDGSKGADGTNGINGTNGVDGKDGERGPQGTPGTNGTNGVDGNNGVDGKNGIDGAAGANGTNGIDGKDGAQGTPGIKGDKGDIGPAGKDGTNGVDGAAGVNGTNGTNGAVGAPGPAPVLSTTSNTQQTTQASGGFTFTVPAGHSFVVGMYVRILSATLSGGNPIAMTGRITATTATTLTVAVDSGPANYIRNDWTITLNGPMGPAGANGTNGAAGPGVPVGGTAGQVLTKSSATDYATAWGRQPFVGASRNLSADLAMASSVANLYGYATVVRDSDGFTTGLTTNQAFKIPVGRAGLYRVSAFYSIGATQNGGAAFILLVNGVAAWESRIAVPAYAVGSYTTSRTGILQLAAGDVLSWQYYANTSGITLQSGKTLSEISLELIA